MKKTMSMTMVAVISATMLISCGDDKKDESGTLKISKMTIGLSPSMPIMENGYIWEGNRMIRNEIKESVNGVLILVGKSEISYVGSSDTQVDEVIDYADSDYDEKNAVKSNWIKRPVSQREKSVRNAELQQVQKLKFNYTNGVATRIDRYIPNDLGQFEQYSSADIEYTAGSISKLTDKLVGTNTPIEEVFFVWQNGNMVSMYSKMPAGMNMEWITVDSTHCTFDDKNSAYKALNQVPVFQIEAVSKNNVLTMNQYAMMDYKGLTEILSVNSTFTYRSDNYPDASTNVMVMAIFPMPMTIFGKYEYK
jgi:hypothetical protein